MHKNRKRPEPTFKYINSLFYYDPIEGKIYSKVKRGKKGQEVNIGDEVGTFRLNKKKGLGYYVIYLPHINGEFQGSEKKSKLAFLLMMGRIPKDGFLIDHEDGDTTNDKWDNLQEINYSLNSIKAKKFFKKIMNLPKCVTWDNYNQTYMIRLKRNGKVIFRTSNKNKEIACEIARKQINLYNSENHSDSCCTVPSTIISNTSENNVSTKISDFCQ